jgi:hypothetical protein
LKDNYEFERYYEDSGYTHCVLRRDGVTARGVGLNDTYEKVVAAYGASDTQYYDETGELRYIKYFPADFPFEYEPYMDMYFYFERGLVSEVSLAIWSGDQPLAVFVE